MENKSVIVEKTYNASIDTVWKAITERDQLKQWYFNFPADWELKVGSQFEWYAGPPDGRQWLHRGKMIEIIDKKKLVHSWEYPGYKGSSIVTWELIPVDQKTTKLILTHQFVIPFDENVEALRRENFVEGWNQILNVSLMDFLK